MRQELEKWFKGNALMLSTLRVDAEARVVRWVYSVDEIWSYWDLRRKGADTSILTGPEGALFACGYDIAEQPIVLREYGYESKLVPADFTVPDSSSTVNKTPNGELMVEEFLQYNGETISVTCFRHGKIGAVHKLHMRDRLITEYESYQQSFYHHVRFEYSGRRRKLRQEWSDTGRVIHETTYGPNGEQTFYRVRRDGTRFRLGDPLPKGVTLKQLKETIRERLLIQVPEIIARSGIVEPIYCVTLAYDNEGNDPLPPSIGIGLESERNLWIKQHGPDASSFIWNPAEFTCFETTGTQFAEDEELEVACDLMNTELAGRGSVSQAIKLLIEVAIALNKAAWPSTVRRTDDFFVYAVDLEFGSFRKNLKATLGPEQLASLKRRRLL